MKVFTVLSVCTILVQLSHQAPGQINYRFLNLTKTQTTTPKDSSTTDDFYYYDEELASPSKKTNESYLNDDYYDEALAPLAVATTTTATTTTTSTTTISTTTSTKLDNYNYYDDYDNLDYENYDYESKDPYTCPARCKCSFKKVAKVVRQRRYLKDDSDYTYEYTDEANSGKEKYNIDVDCSGADLTSIAKLFEDEFPLNQIVSL